MSDLDFLSPLRKTSDAIRIHGHRGARGVLPENTMAGCRNTLDIGLKVLELDILVTADGIPVVTHYPRLITAATRDQNGMWLSYDSPLIYTMSFDTLQKFDIGGLRADTAYGKKYPDQAFLTGVRVPSLAQVAGLIKEPKFDDVWLNLEIKSSPEAPENTPPLPELVSTILQIRKYLTGFLSSHLIGGFYRNYNARCQTCPGPIYLIINAKTPLLLSIYMRDQFGWMGCL
ncbi:MAG: glycerophosphodiester phosphodiesterase family protein [Rhodobacterales bacterium]